jgi:tetratricopeptide (TPR) repeat protein
VVALATLVGGIIAVIGVSLWYWHAQSPPEPPSIDLANAEPAIAHVIQKALTAVREKPRSADAWGHLGLVLRAHAYNDESDVCFAQAERLDPKDPRWPYLQGTQLRFRHPDAALPFIERAVERCDKHAPNKTAPRLLLAEMLLAKGRTDDARSHLRKVLDRTPDDPRANYDMGLVAFASDDLDGSIQYLRHASDSPFTAKKAAAQLALVYERQNDETTAAAFNQRARELPPDLLWIDEFVNEYQELEVGRQGRLKHAEFLEHEQRLQEGLEVYRQLLEEFPDDRSHVSLGITLLKAGDAVTAEAVLREAIRQAPDNVQGHYFLCVALYQQGENLRQQPGKGDLALTKYREGAEAGNRAAAIKPDHALAHAFRGLCQRQLGDRGGAIASLRTSIRCRPELADVHYWLGEALADSGLDLDALKELQAALDLAQHDPNMKMDARARLEEEVRAPYARALTRIILAGFPPAIP